MRNYEKLTSKACKLAENVASNGECFQEKLNSKPVNSLKLLKQAEKLVDAIRQYQVSRGETPDLSRKPAMLVHYDKSKELLAEAERLFGRGQKEKGNRLWDEAYAELEIAKRKAEELRDALHNAEKRKNFDWFAE